MNGTWLTIDLDARPRSLRRYSPNSSSTASCGVIGGSAAGASVAQHGKQPLQGRPIAWLDALPPRSVTDVPLDHAFIEISRPRAAACHPTQQIADQIEAPQSALASEPLFDEARRVELNELSVGSTLQAPEQPAPVLRNHHPVLRC
jgi:hypothetical protein